MKKIKSDNRFDYFTKMFLDIEITFRVDRADGNVYFLVNDNFARANGYDSCELFPDEVKQMLNSCFGSGEAWILFDQEEGDFVGYPFSITN